MKQKLIDTNAQISSGGRANVYWRDKKFTPRGAAMVVGGSTPTDLNLQKILTTYQMKGFEFGNWLTNNDRYDRVIAAESSLRDLALIMGTMNLGINQQVGLAFGARGVSSALAHYEPGANMINLTKEKGFGSLAHEYGHALDYNIGSFIDQHKNHPSLSGGSSTARTLPDNTGAQFRWYVNKIVDAIKSSESYSKMSAEKSYRDSYWHRRTELWARFFEQYICWKLKQKKLNNTFLCKSWGTYTTRVVYLSEKDFAPLVKIMDEFCGEVAKFISGKKTSLVSRPYPVAIAAERKEAKPKAQPKVKPVKKKTIKRPTTPKGPVKVSKAVLMDAKLKKQLFKVASSKNDIRRKITGIYYDKSGFVIATDGHKLAAIKCQFSKALEGKIMDRNGEEIKGDRYPDWKSVIPSTDNAKEMIHVNLKEEIVSLEKMIKQYKEEEKKEKAASSNKKTKGTSQRVVSIKSLNVNGEKLLSLYKVFAVIGSTCDVYLLPENKMIFIRNGQHLAILMTVV